MIAYAIDPTDTCLFQGVAQITCLEPLLAQIIGIAASLSGMVFFIMLIIGGFRCLFSGGNPKAMEGCKGTITAAFLGLLLVVLSYLFLSLLSSFTGLDLTVFRIEIF